MVQPFRLKIATSKVKLLVSVYTVGGKQKNERETICVDAYESTSVYNLGKVIEKRFKVKAKNIIFYYMKTQMKIEKSLGEYGIYAEKEEYYKIRVIEKLKINNKLSLGLNPNFYKINSLRKSKFNKFLQKLKFNET